MRQLLKRAVKYLGMWDLWVGLSVMLERLKEEMSPFPAEPWRRG